MHGADDCTPVCYRSWPMTSRRALITGITGQDGSYLAELLLSEGYEVFGLVRRLSASNYWRIQHILDRVTLIPGDLLDQLSLIRALERAQPHELYNLAAMSFVPASWDQPMLTGEFNSQGVTRVLEAGCPMRQKTRGIDLGGHVRQHPLYALETGDRFAELHSFFGVFCCCLKRPGSNTECLRSDTWP